VVRVAGCKAFYMRLNDDNKTVGAMDVLFPRVGEMVRAEGARSPSKPVEARRSQLTVAGSGWTHERGGDAGDDADGADGGGSADG
jgi:hypothetical protein